MRGLCFRLLERNSSSIDNILLLELILIDPSSLGRLVFVKKFLSLSSILLSYSIYFIVKLITHIGKILQPLWLCSRINDFNPLFSSL